MNRIYVLAAFSAALCAVMSVAAWAADAPPVTNPQVKDVYPSLASSALTTATLGPLPAGVLLQSGNYKITQKEIDAVIAKSPAAGRAELKRNQFFLLENQATSKLLELEARFWAKSKASPSVKAADELITDYLLDTVKGVSVSDEQIKAFYDQNREMVGSASYDDTKDELRQYLQGQKQQDAVNSYVFALGQRNRVLVNAAWTARQVVLAMDNPVDKARKSGQLTMVDFGADGCQPCEMMTPILADLKTEYAGKVNIVFVQVRQQQILAARFGVQSIPVQVFFDAKGKEVFRHVGFFAKADIIAKLTELGAK